jgi:hypothetical protein
MLFRRFDAPRHVNVYPLPPLVVNRIVMYVTSMKLIMYANYNMDNFLHISSNYTPKTLIVT